MKVSVQRLLIHWKTTAKDLEVLEFRMFFGNDFFKVQASSQGLLLPIYPDPEPLVFQK